MGHHKYNRSLDINKNSCLLKGRKVELRPKQKTKYFKTFLPFLSWLAKLARIWCLWNCVHGLHPTGGSHLIQKEAFMESQAVSLCWATASSTHATHQIGHCLKDHKGRQWQSTLAALVAQFFNPLKKIKIERLDHKTQTQGQLLKQNRRQNFLMNPKPVDWANHQESQILHGSHKSFHDSHGISMGGRRK